MKVFICKNCKTEWEFIPKDYNYNKKSYPNRCPLCSMPITQMIRDTYQQGGIREVSYWLFRRLFGKFLSQLEEKK